MSEPWNDPPAVEQLLSVNQRLRKGAVVVTVAGAIDAATVPRLHAALGHALRRAQTRRVVIDLRGVPSLSSADLAALARAARHTTIQHPEPIRVVADHNLLDPILIMQLDQTLSMHRTLTEALMT